MDGTGDLLSALKPSVRIGADLSSQMIVIARDKYKENIKLKFSTYNEYPSGTFDYLIMVDLIEHLEKRLNLFNRIYSNCTRKSQVIILMANPIWEPLLLFAEKLGLKMPEGPHVRVSFRTVEKELLDSRFEVKEHGFRQLIHKKIFLISDLINDHFHKIPIVNKICLTEYIIVKIK